MQGCSMIAGLPQTAVVCRAEMQRMLLANDPLTSATVASMFTHIRAQFYFTLRNGRPAVDSNSGQRISLRVFRDAFARGSSRIVHWALLDGQRFVVKKYMG